MSHHGSLPPVGQAFNGQMSSSTSRRTNGYQQYGHVVNGQPYSTTGTGYVPGPAGPYIQAVAHQQQPQSMQQQQQQQQQQHHQQYQPHQTQSRPPQPLASSHPTLQGYSPQQFSIQLNGTLPAYNGGFTSHAPTQLHVHQPQQPQRFAPPPSQYHPVQTPTYPGRPQQLQHQNQQPQQAQPSQVSQPQSQLQQPRAPQRSHSSPSAAQTPPPPRPQESYPPSSAAPRPGGIQINIPMKTPAVVPPGSRTSSSGGIAKPSPVSRSPALKHAKQDRKVSPASKSPALRHDAVAKSPLVSPHPSVNHPSLLIHVADELLSKAQGGSLTLAVSGSESHLDVYHRLVATGLACLESAISSNRLPPRIEAKARLRYAGLVVEETEDLMEAETMLTKGIALAETHLFADLKYCMQYLLIKAILRRGLKAAMVALDKAIAECNTFNHVEWSYAFRFLKATLLFQSSNLSDTSAIVDTLKGICALSNARRDYTVYVFASLLEGLAHLRQDKPDAVVRVQSCMAQASKYQLETTHLAQIDILWLLLDLACSLREKKPDPSLAKMKSLTDRMDQLPHDDPWDSSELLLPVYKDASSSSTVTKDTDAIVRRGTTEDKHFLVLTFISKRIDASAIVHAFIGLAMLYQRDGGEGKSIWAWKDTLATLARMPAQHLPRNSQPSLQQAMRLNRWSSSMKCFAYIVLGLLTGTRGEWGKVQYCVGQIDDLIEDGMDRSIQDMAWYLRGVCFQGRGKLDDALAVWSQGRFALQMDGGAGDAGGSSAGACRELSLIAALNRLWILQDPKHRDESLARQLVEALEPTCEHHPDPDVKTAWNLVMSTMTDPNLHISITKRYIQGALNWSQANRNVQCLSIALNIMRWRLFDNLMGEQALKSAKAASQQAKKVGNKLWLSVAENMLATSQALQNDGQHSECERNHASAIAYANEALARREEPPASSL